VLFIKGKWRILDKDFPSQLLRAISFAAKKHTRQRRKNAEQSPYIEHPVQVAQYLWEVGGVRDPEIILAAVLHDTIEDTGTTSQEISIEFGDRVAGIVVEVTDDKSLPKHERKQLQIEHAPTLTEAAKLVKLADKICNIRDVVDDPPQGWDIQRRNEYLIWAQSVVNGLRGINEIMEREFEEIVTKGLKQLS